MKLTNFQEQQLFALKLQGQFAYRNEAGNLYPRKAWREMIATLRRENLVDSELRLTAAGHATCDEIHERRMGVFGEHQQQIRRQNANMPKPIRDLLE